MSSALLPKVTVILRGYTTDQVLTVAEQLVGTSVNSVEVASNSPDAMESIAAMKKEFGESLHVGAGTVVSYEIASQAIDAGAEFALSPIMFSQEIMKSVKDNGLIAVPSAFSPTEVKTMFNMGADIVKIFPASALGPSYIKAIEAPLGKMPLMVVGGVNTDNVATYFENGASYAGIGSGIFKHEDIVAQNKEGLKASLSALLKKIENL